MFIFVDDYQLLGGADEFICCSRWSSCNGKNLNPRCKFESPVRGRISSIWRFWVQLCTLCCFSRILVQHCVLYRCCFFARARFAFFWRPSLRSAPYLRVSLRSLCESPVSLATWESCFTCYFVGLASLAIWLWFAWENGNGFCSPGYDVDNAACFSGETLFWIVFSFDLNYVFGFYLCHWKSFCPDQGIRRTLLDAAKVTTSVENVRSLASCVRSLASCVRSLASCVRSLASCSFRKSCESVRIQVVQGHRLDSLIAS